MGITSIVIALIGMIGGASGTLLFYKENKTSKKSNVISELMKSLDELGKAFRQQQEDNNKYTNSLIEIINEKNAINADNLRRFDKLERDSKLKDQQIAKIERVSKGQEKVIAKIIEEKKKSERLICIKESCTIRVPKLGTYKPNED